MKAVTPMRYCKDVTAFLCEILWKTFLKVSLGDEFVCYNHEKQKKQDKFAVPITVSIWKNLVGKEEKRYV